MTGGGVSSASTALKMIGQSSGPCLILALSISGNHSGRAASLCPNNLDFNLFSDGKRVIDLDAEIPHRTLDLGVPKQELYRA